MQTFAGIDLGFTTCELTVVDEQGHVLLHTSFTPDAQGVSSVLPSLSRIAGRWKQRMQVAVEDPGALLTNALAQEGYRLRPVHAVALARFRLRLEPSRTKSDGGDSRALAEILRLEPGRHRPLPTFSPSLLGLRALTRARSDAMRRRSKIQRVMWATLSRYYPNAIAAFPDLGSRDALTALRLAPTPLAARRLSATRLAQGLRSAGRRKLVRRGAEEILDALQRPQLRVHPVIEHGHGIALLALIDQFDHLSKTLEGLEAACLAEATEHPHWRIYESFPALGGIAGATLLAEIGDDPQRFGSARGLLSMAGLAPVTRASGPTVYVHRRRIHNRRLGDAAMRWGTALLLHSRPAMARYRQRREHGDTHFSALRRVLAQHMTALHACVRDGRPYDEERFLGDRPELRSRTVATAPIHQPSKYEPLRLELTRRWPAQVSFTFREVDRLVRGGLPRSAYDYSAWWIKRELATSTQARAWYAAGYRVGWADAKQQLVRFDPIEAPVFRGQDPKSVATITTVASTEIEGVEVIHKLS